MAYDAARHAEYEKARAHRSRLIKVHAHKLAAKMATSGAASGGSLAAISLIYESRDGRLCLFEDAQGHISAVDSARLV